jgi:hypothetical protein
MKKIAFLFLIIDNPNFPEIWDKYLDGNEDKYTIYIIISEHMSKDTLLMLF